MLVELRDAGFRGSLPLSSSGSTGRALRLLAGCLFFVLALGAGPTRAEVPTQVAFQGLLLDSGGAPLNDSVDLDFELFDALVAGNSLWSESHLSVIVVDGVYSVNLGQTTPLSQAVLAGGAAFLEIRVSGETLVPRQQLVSVPYALVAEDAVQLGGVSAGFFQAIVAEIPFDGQEPGNEHPDEGLADIDGDGRPNFIDPDNDGDGIDDAEELAEGSSINLVSPRVSSVTPDQVTSWTPSTLTVMGINLETVTSVSWGSETPTPANVSATSFEIDVSTELVAVTQQSVSVTLANGESIVSAPVGIEAVAPTITAWTRFVQAGQPSLITIEGMGFIPGTVVEIGTEVFDPAPHTESTISVALGPQVVGELTIRVIHPNTLFATAPLVVTPVGGARTVFLSRSTNGLFGGLAGADAVCQGDAQAAGLPAGTYRAWLSDGVESPSTRFDQDAGSYFALPDGTPIALTWSDLVDGTLLAPIDVTASGTTGISSFVFTGTLEDGTPVPGSPGAGDCDGWTNAATTGETGRSALTTGWSSAASPLACSTVARLFCFQN